ncbi:carboxymethylenebutenolidase [Hydrogenivirga caldilitoris]|uniref:Carboxymethylenebutenolidase n=1 Tax=Hydrogenivirga caldilitoris TaxID=246264 RepID=A0A497XQB8_9AQUI|nr:dienelactone hydrolase family protein [Hydrogenivirga caldilitoris]RLJ71165.1 carboxymethylenebutenolidase [Hydrogenivirga caldilitoris]
MGRNVEFEVSGVKVTGYLAEPSNKGPAVLIIHEWWGLDSPLSNIKELTDKLAGEGFVAFAPDLYKGKSADNPDDAGKLMTDMFQNRMNEVDAMFRASVEYLKNLDITEPAKVGVTGFCCGGTLSMYFASKFPELIDASVPFYGLPQLAPIDPHTIKVPIFFIMAQNDEFVDNDSVIDLFKGVWKNGVEAQAKVYPGVNHAFLNDRRPDVYNESCAKDAWNLAVEFFRRHLG